MGSHRRAYVRIVRTKKTPRGRRGTGYCCCRVFGSYFSDEAVLIYCYIYCCYFYFYFWLFFFFFASSGFDVWLQMSNMPSSVRTFFVRNKTIARGVPLWKKYFVNKALFSFTAAISAGKWVKCNKIRQLFRSFFLHLT